MAVTRRVLDWLPPRLRLPMAAGVIVFAVAVGTTQVALWIAGREADSRVEQVGQVYLDGLAAAVRPTLADGDLAGLRERLRLAFSEQQGIAERALFVFTAEGTLLAREGDPSLPLSTAREVLAGGFRIDETAGVAWVPRALARRTGPALVAALDVGDMLAARRRLTVGVVLIDLVIAALCALLASVVLERLGRPLGNLVEELEAAASRPAVPVPAEHLPAADERTRKVIEAFNRMVLAQQERERLARRLADREQAAALGRLAATLAHEVRNPLGGLATAVSTLRRFGADEAVREESLAFLDRGIAALDGIVTSTLNLYRPEQERRLGRADFDDIVRLVRPVATRGELDFTAEIELPQTVSVGAVGVRQVLLNLLLNACAVTPPGGHVTLTAAIEESALVCTVADEGRGMDPTGADRLTGSAGAPAEGSRRLGMEVVVSILGGLEGRASVQSEPGRGTLVRVAIPLEGSA